MTVTPTPGRQPAATKKRGAWAVLLVAGGFEIGYALSVKGSAGFSAPLWALAAVAFFLLTMFFLSVALRNIDVSVGYAVWTGIGAIGAAVLGPVLFDEVLTWTKAFWLAVIITGVVVLKLADRPETESRHPVEPSQG